MTNETNEVKIFGLEAEKGR